MIYWEKCIAISMFGGHWKYSKKKKSPNKDIKGNTDLFEVW